MKIQQKEIGKRKRNWEKPLSPKQYYCIITQDPKAKLFKRQIREATAYPFQEVKSSHKKHFFSSMHEKEINDMFK